MRIFLVLLIVVSIHSQISLPIEVFDRQAITSIQLTDIGEFALIRKERPTVKSHYHTGVDIMRPSDNYESIEAIYPIAAGTVISKREDGPYAQLIIEHHFEGKQFWTLYEHIAGIAVNVSDSISAQIPIARFMNLDELNRYGWQFDHFHFEILKVKPIKIQPGKKTPGRNYNSYTLSCYTLNQLHRYFYDPIDFLKQFIGE